MELLEDDVVSVNLEDPTLEMTTFVDGDAEISEDGVKEMSQERTAEFEEYTAQAREASRKDSGTEHLQHNSPGLQKKHIAPQERDLNIKDPREGTTEPQREATPLQAQLVSQEQRPGAQSTEEDTMGPQREVTPPRKQAVWVTEAVAACQANKKVRFPRYGFSDQDKH